MPGSTKQIRCHQEMMMLCWKFLEINKVSIFYILSVIIIRQTHFVYFAICKINIAYHFYQRFRNYLLETDKVLDLLIVLLYYAIENKQDSGLVY